MELQRLVIDAGDRSLAADLHPRLTVIGGLTEKGRGAFAGELVDALAGARPGVHLEAIVRGTPIAVFRPLSGRHRVVDTETVREVTGDFLGPSGEIDLFAVHGVDRALGRRVIGLSRSDLATDSEADAHIAHLATIDQEELWESAMRLRSSQQLLEKASATTGTTTEDAAAVAQVEQRHAELVAATESYDRVRLIAMTITALGLISAAAIGSLDSDKPTFPLLALTMIGAALTFIYRHAMTTALRAEREVLAPTGADDYTSFQLARVSSLLDTDQERRRLMRAVTHHHSAESTWQALVGDISLEFVLDHENEIRAASARQAKSPALQAVARATAGDPDEVVLRVAQAVLARVEAVNALTDTDDGLPMILEDPFVDLDHGVCETLLGMLASHAGQPQMIFVTAQEEVLSWAKVSTIGGRVGVVQPTVESSPAS